MYMFLVVHQFHPTPIFWNLTEHQPALFEYVQILTMSGNSKSFPFWQVAYLPHWNSMPQPKESVTWYMLPPVPLEWRGGHTSKSAWNLSENASLFAESNHENHEQTLWQALVLYQRTNAYTTAASRSRVWNPIQLTLSSKNPKNEEILSQLLSMFWALRGVKKRFLSLCLHSFRPWYEDPGDKVWTYSVLAATCCNPKSRQVRSLSHSQIRSWQVFLSFQF